MDHGNLFIAPATQLKGYAGAHNSGAYDDELGARKI